MPTGRWGIEHRERSRALPRPRATSMRSTPRSGWSFVALALTVVLLSAAVGTVSMVSTSIAHTPRGERTRSELEESARLAVEEIAAILMEARIDSLSPDPRAPASTECLEFQRAIYRENQPPVWTDPERVEVLLDPGELDDGLDNDGDLLVDERTAFLVKNSGSENELRRVLAEGVSRFALDEASQRGRRQRQRRDRRKRLELRRGWFSSHDPTGSGAARPRRPADHRQRRDNRCPSIRRRARVRRRYGCRGFGRVRRPGGRWLSARPHRCR